MAVPVLQMWNILGVDLSKPDLSAGCFLSPSSPHPNIAGSSELFPHVKKKSKELLVVLEPSITCVFSSLRPELELLAL